jgi:hypothetical protein
MTHALRDLIRRMSKANPFVGAPRIHGELLKLGIKMTSGTVGANPVKEIGVWPATAVRSNEPSYCGPRGSPVPACVWDKNGCFMILWLAPSLRGIRTRMRTLHRRCNAHHNLHS